MSSLSLSILKEIRRIVAYYYDVLANIQDGSLQEDSNSNAQELPLFSPSHLSSTETPSPKSKRSRNLSDEVYSSPTRKNLDYQVSR